MKRVRVVVVGAGHLGTYHLQKLAADPECELVGVVDIDAAQRAKAAQAHQIPAAADLSQLAVEADAAVIATPTVTHRQVGEAALARGWHILVEKPLAHQAAEARALAQSARAHGRLVQVGHTERFNPAIAAALALADRPRYIVSERLGPFTGRSADVDIILDLMIHDLDVVATLVPSPLVETRAVGVPIITQEIDMAAVRLAFADGTVAQLSAGRASLEVVRKIRLFTLERYVSIDCVAREVKSVRRLPPAAGSTWPQIVGEPVEVPPGDPLALQDHDFIVCVREGRAPRVDAQAGVRAVELAEAIKAEIKIPLPQGA